MMSLTLNYANLFLIPLTYSEVRVEKNHYFKQI